MSQNNFVVENAAAPTARSDLTAALQALASCSSGASAPASTYADMLWYDTVNNQLKKRNETNSAWITLGTVDEVNSKFEPNQTFATQAEAQAGSNNTKPVTPLRVAEAIAALSPSTTPFETWGCTVTLASTSSLIIPSGKEYIIIACGGGGGGAIVSSGSVNSDTKALGGNGGSVVLLKGLTSSSTTLTITIGAGGAGKTSGTSNGNLGGNTTVTGTGISISAAGGKGGLQVGTVAVASDANAASSGGIVFEPGLWNVGAHTDGNISFSGTAILGGGGTLSGSTTTGMTGGTGNDSFNSRFVYQSITTINNFTEDETRAIWPLQAQSIGSNIGQPTIMTSTAGGIAGDASADTGGGAGVYGGGGGGGADSASSSGAGGGGFVVLWVQK